MIFTCFRPSSHWISLHSPTVKPRRENWMDSSVSRWGRVSLPSLGWPGTGFEDTWPWAHRDPSTSAFQLLGFKVCGTQSLLLGVPCSRFTDTCLCKSDFCMRQGLMMPADLKCLKPRCPSSGWGFFFFFFRLWRSLELKWQSQASITAVAGAAMARLWAGFSESECLSREGQARGSELGLLGKPCYLHFIVKTSRCRETR